MRVLEGKSRLLVPFVERCLLVQSLVNLSRLKVLSANVCFACFQRVRFGLFTCAATCERGFREREGVGVCRKVG